jgi:hypothetical protein
MRTPCAPRVRRFGSCRRQSVPYAPWGLPGASDGSLSGRRRGTKAACGRGGKRTVAIPAILTRLPDPGHAVRLQDCKVSTLGRALHCLDQMQAAWRRAAARHWWQFDAVTKSCEIHVLHMGGDLVVSAYRIFSMFSFFQSLVFRFIRPKLGLKSTCSSRLSGLCCGF